MVISVAQPTARRKFYALDGLRGIAALAVVTLHLHGSLDPIFLPSGYLAVDLFFMISGIVIAHSYDARLANGLSVGRLLLIRFIRLFPLYALGLAVATAGALLAISAGQSTWTITSLVPAVVFQAAMLPNLLGVGLSPYLYPQNLAAWSLSWELAINVVYAAAFPVLSPRVLATTAVVAGAVLTAFAAHRGGLDFGSRRDEWVVGLPRVVFAFTVGVLIERRRASEALPTWTAPAWSLILLTAGALAAPSLGWVADVVIVIVYFPLICIAATQSAPRSVQLYTFVGVISYPLYVTHIPFPYEWLTTAIVQRPLPAWTPWSQVVLIATMLLTSWLLTRFYDEPVRRALTSALLGGTPRSAGVS